MCSPTPASSVSDLVRRLSISSGNASSNNRVPHVNAMTSGSDQDGRIQGNRWKVLALRDQCTADPSRQAGLTIFHSPEVK